MNRPSFILHMDSLQVLEELTDEQAGQLFKAIRKFNQGGQPELDFALRMAFLPFKNQMIRDEERYKLTVNRNTENINKRWDKVKAKLTTGINGKEEIPAIPLVTKDTDSDNDSVNVSDSGSGSASDSDNISDSDSENKRKVNKHLETSAAAPPENLLDKKPEYQKPTFAASEINQDVVDENSKKLFTACKGIYTEWFEKFSGAGPKIDTYQNNALTQLIAYMGGEVIKKARPPGQLQTPLGHDEYAQKVQEGFQYIFSNWHKLDSFLSQKTKLTEINSNIQNIIVQIKNPVQKNGNKLTAKPPWRK